MILDYLSFSLFIMVSRFFAYQSFCINLLADFTKKQEEFVGKSPIKKYNTSSNTAFTLLKALLLPKTLTSLLVPLSIKDLFIHFIKTFIELKEAQIQIRP